ncbi:MAG: RlmE family RNA methyltransferase [Holosporales bacterium]
MTKTFKKPPSVRPLSVRLKTARGRKVSSQLWLQRQLNDPYVHQAKAMGYRSRAAFKLLQINDKVGVFKKGQRVVDLGAAPGGWTQVIVDLVALDQGRAQVVGIDLLPIDPMPGVAFLEGDFMDPAMQEAVRGLLAGPADVVVSDMAANTTGSSVADHLRTIALAETAYLFAEKVLRPGGAFIAKVFQGGTDGELLKRLKSHFDKVRHIKPAASRKGSPEMYVVATGFKL